MSPGGGRHPTDEERAAAAAPALEALMQATRTDDGEALERLFDPDAVWVDATGTVRGGAQAVARHRALAARATEWAPPQQQGARAVLRWARRDPAGEVEEGGVVVVEIRRGRVVFAAS